VAKSVTRTLPQFLFIPMPIPAQTRASPQQLISELQAWGDNHCSALPYAGVVTDLLKCLRSVTEASDAQYVLQVADVFYCSTRTYRKNSDQVTTGAAEFATLFDRNSAHKAAFELPQCGDSRWTVVSRKMALATRSEWLMSALQRRLSAYSLKAAIDRIRIELDKPEFLRDAQMLLYALILTMDTRHKGKYVLTDGLAYLTRSTINEQFQFTELKMGSAHEALPMSKDEAYKLRFALHEATDKRWAIIEKDTALENALAVTYTAIEQFLGDGRPSSDYRSAR
jgi:hypothetical protein